MRNSIPMALIQLENHIKSTNWQQNYKTGKNPNINILKWYLLKQIIYEIKKVVFLCNMFHFC